jgi:hypothetical protein
VNSRLQPAHRSPCEWSQHPHYPCPAVPPTLAPRIRAAAFANRVRGFCSSLGTFNFGLSTANSRIAPLVPTKFRIFFQVPYGLSPLFAILVKTAGVYPVSSHPETCYAAPATRQSPFRLFSYACELPSFCHTLRRSFFSTTSNRQILQTFCFDNHTKCRGGVPPKLFVECGGWALLHAICGSAAFFRECRRTKENTGHQKFQPAACPQQAGRNLVSYKGKREEGFIRAIWVARRALALAEAAGGWRAE